MRVRAAENSLADAIGIAYVQVVTWQVAYRGLLPNSVLEGLSVEDAASRWKGRLGDPAITMFVLEIGGSIVGFVSCGAARDDDLDAGRVGEIYAIYVQPAHWRQGHGCALMTAALSALGKRGYEDVVLWTLRDNGPAIAFYEQIGFTRDGQRQIRTRTDGTEMVVARYRLMDAAGDGLPRALD